MDLTEYQESRELSELLNDLIIDGQISHDVAVGIAKQIIDKGIESLSSAQMDVYERYIEQIFNDERKVCKRCQCPITDLAYNERNMLISTGYCPLCDYRMSKDD